MGSSLAPAWEADLGGYRLVFDRGALDRLGELTRAAGGERALVVTDRGVREAGHLERALESLRAARIECSVYDGVESNPTTRHVDEGVSTAREHGADCLVGLGGGSSMDCAKGVNFLLTNGGRMEDYWGSGKATRPMLPSIGVPTTAGTGSDAQSYALIGQEGTGRKMACGDPKAMFRAVILDPLLVASTPKEVAAMSGIDAVSHAVESYVSTRSNPISRLYAREAWCSLDRYLPQVLVDREDTAAWGELLLASHLAGAAIERSMLGAAHACANPLTARFSIPHGIAVGLMLPHVVRYNSSHAGSRYAELVEATNPSGAPVPLEDRLRELRSAAGLPASLRDFSVPEARLAELAAEAEEQWTAGFNPRPVTQEELFELYKAAHHE